MKVYPPLSAPGAWCIAGVLLLSFTQWFGGIVCLLVAAAYFIKGRRMLVPSGESEGPVYTSPPQ